MWIDTGSPAKASSAANYRKSQLVDNWLEELCSFYSPSNLDQPASRGPATMLESHQPCTTVSGRSTWSSTAPSEYRSLNFRQHDIQFCQLLSVPDHIRAVAEEIQAIARKAYKMDATVEGTVIDGAPEAEMSQHVSENLLPPQKGIICRT